MTSQEAFEKWKNINFHTVDSDAEYYLFCGWQASRAALLEEIKAGGAVAWMHDAPGRVDCISDNVKSLWLKVGEKMAYKIEHYTQPLYRLPEGEM